MGEQVECGDGLSIGEFVSPLTGEIEYIRAERNELQVALWEMTQERDALQAALHRACVHASYCATECPRMGGECTRPEEMNDERNCSHCGFDCDVDFVAECWRLKFMQPEGGIPSA